MKKSEFLKFLSIFELSYGKITKILSILPESLSFDDFVNNHQMKEILGEDFEKISSQANEQTFDKYLSYLANKNITLLTCFDDDYPQKFDKIDDKPYYLFCMGDIKLLNKKCVSIVGTRLPTNYGINVTERFSKSLAKAGAVIVSGLAYGVDGLAHRKALEYGKTIAVIAGGFDKIYPPEHTSLFKEIAEKGLVISEHRPDVRVAKYSFPQRNRLVAALGDVLLITEAGAKSGTTITKDFALDYGTPIYAVPGNITSSKSEGTNSLIASMQGICALDEKAILSELGLSAKKSASVQLNLQESLIVSSIPPEGCDIDEIVEKTKLSISNINSLLTSLEIKGIIKKMPGGIITQG